MTCSDQQGERAEPYEQTPKRNIAAFQLLFEIETVLRELIIDEFELQGDARWYKTRLPPDLAEKYRKGLIYERSIHWRNLIPHHPMYYLDFPDLKKIIEQNRNWNDWSCPASVDG